ncbi:hypothetical protein RNP97_003681 [Enterobacter bugandensis]|jgi:hypothetical protein|uniref:hypothetical protein n=1 Tax=Enterobacter TaxID=547 RepID=UPI000A776F2A|nr:MULTISPECIES: hypothetical protein [Enterobacter]EHN8829674.1 hypothetical protein [Enterobacter bugandensis]EHN8847602.1 hypothetical protein [Enterobacter bugandensis]ELF8873268.1 hypothetical protein [Enterobacter bugandensis]ELQ3995746.1 hypothetical protein [Enterobacter bugandensis]ELV3040962.1 hypothetical protein [Enterobacter bugandensis]
MNLSLTFICALAEATFATKKENARITGQENNNNTSSRQPGNVNVMLKVPGFLLRLPGRQRVLPEIILSLL